jgi:N-acetylmuramoyl-L-alanine amidase
MLALSAISAAGQPALYSQTNKLHDVRVWSTGEVTRVALEVASEVKFHHDRLQAPARVYIDLYETRPDPSHSLTYRLAVADGPIKQIRVALTQPTVTRVVLDLEGAVEYSVSQLANPDRVMLEVRRSGTAPAAAPAPPPPSPQPPAQLKPVPKPFVLPAAFTRRTARPYFIERAPRIAAPTIKRVKAHLFATDQPQPPETAKETSPETAQPPTAIVAKASPPPAAPLIAAAKAAPPPVVTLPAAAAAKASVTAADKPVEIPSNPGVAPRPAQRNGSGNRSLTRVLGLKLNRVVLDPGHGGYDHGTTGRSVIEKELVLDVANRLGKLIEDRLGAEVVFTRTADTFVHLEDRTRIANEQRADLFLSIHANSSPYKTVSGTETYYLSFTNSRDDMEVAARENAGSQRSIHELSDLLRKIALQEKAEESREFAARVQASAYELAVQSNGKIRNRGVKKAPFVVLIGAKMPSILTEIGFVSNAREESLLKRDDHRQKIAEALYKGIYQYAETLSNFRVASRGQSSAAQ